MRPRILVTGSKGLVGTALSCALRAGGIDVVGLDLRGEGIEGGDVRDRERVGAAVKGCHGVVHLAAMSRIVAAERDPDACWATNVGGVRNIIEAAAVQSRPPWLVFASSREVYGEQVTHDVPVREDSPFRPMNVYGRTKVEGEELAIAARRRGVRSAVVRLSNVYGGAADHSDRVVPAFVRAALTGEPLRVEGPDRGFDFTHIDDVTRALTTMVEVLDGGAASIPTVHLVTGHMTTLAELARLVIASAGARPAAPIVEVGGRTCDVARFVGDPRRAAAVLDWRSTIAVASGIERYTEASRRGAGIS